MNHPLTSYTDEELIVLMKTDSTIVAEIFSELYDRHKNRIYAYTLRVTVSRDDARDILQETFIRFYQSLQTTFIANVGAYLLITARNLCLNQKRSQRNYEKLSEDIPAEEFLIRFEHKDLITQLSKALACVDFDQREAFVLRYYHTLEYEEIAEITGQNINTIRNRVWRAKEKIKTLLAPIIKEISA